MNSLKPLDYFFLMRPVLFFPGWATLLAGYAAAARSRPFVDALRQGLMFQDGGRLAAALFSFAAAMGGCFVLNQMRDISSDRRNNKLFLLGEGYVSPRAALIEASLLTASALITAALINAAFFGLVAAFILLTGWLYNLPPFPLKDRPLGGLAANVIMGWLAFALGRSLCEPMDLRLLAVSLPYVLFNTALYFLTTLPDYEGDRAAGKITFPVRYGLQRTIIVSLAFFVASAAVSFFQRNQTMLLIGAAAAPFMTRLALRRTVPAAVVAVKAGIAAFALTMCLLFPFFLPLLATLFFFTRFYYRRRFNFDYPNFRGC